jgi:hypothetical protein
MLPQVIAPPQAISIEESNSTRHAPIINAWTTMTLWEEGLKTGHLRIRKTDNIAQ